MFSAKSDNKKMTTLAASQAASYKNPSQQAHLGASTNKKSKKSKRQQQQHQLQADSELNSSEESNHKGESNTSSASSSGYLSHSNNNNVHSQPMMVRRPDEIYYQSADDQYQRQVPSNNQQQQQFVGNHQFYYVSAPSGAFRAGAATRPLPMMMTDAAELDHAGDNQFVGAADLIDDDGGGGLSFDDQLQFDRAPTGDRRVYAFGVDDEDLCVDSADLSRHHRQSSCLDAENVVDQRRFINLNRPPAADPSVVDHVGLRDRYANFLYQHQQQNPNQFAPYQQQQQYYHHSLTYNLLPQEILQQQRPQFYATTQQKQSLDNINSRHQQQKQLPSINQRLINDKTSAKMQANSSSRQHLTGSTLSAPQHPHHNHSGSRRSQNNSSKSPRKHQQHGTTSKHNVNKNSAGNYHANGKPALGFCAKLAKALLFLANILFWLAGLALGAWGILSLVDDHKYNLSQLLVFEANSRMSLFQLLAWSFITLGCATILVGFCGCSAILKNNRWILGLYIFLILAIFALDLATGLLAIIFQERLVANVRLRLGNKLKTEYGIQASFTAAIDYIQTRYECCGLEGHFDYDQSLWRLQRLGGFEATVARTCCHLRNTLDDQAHINPRPVNESMCQSTDVRFHQSYRYRRGCLEDLERLVRHKIWNFTMGCAAVGAVILLSLFFATCFCRSIPSASHSKRNSRDGSRDEGSGQQQQHSKKQHPGGSVSMTANQIDSLAAAQAAQATQQRHYR